MNQGLIFLRRIVGELWEAIGVEKTEVQWLKLQLIYEYQAVQDTKAESEVLRRQRQELKGQFGHKNRVYIHNLYKKKELEEKIIRLK